MLLDNRLFKVVCLLFVCLLVVNLAMTVGGGETVFGVSPDNHAFEIAEITTVPIDTIFCSGGAYGTCGGG